MPNSRVKGNRSRRKAIEYYEHLGWTIDVCERTGRFIKYKDLFAKINNHGFDLIGIKNNKVILVQVKTNVLPNQGAYLDIASQFAGENVIIESYTWFDIKGPVVVTYNNNGTISKNDMRKHHGQNNQINT